LYFNAADQLSYTSEGVAQVTFTNGAILPVTTNDINLGSSDKKFKDLYVDGTAYMDAVAITSGTITGISTLADLGNSVPLTFSTTTTDADPGAGAVRLNNSTQNAATAFYIDDADSNSVAISSFVQSLTGGNNPSATLGFITLRKQFAPSVFATYKVTAVVNASGYTKLTVANLAYSATNPFSDADEVLLSIDLAGDKGDAGDMAGPASSTDNAVARFNGTGGSAVQNTAVIIDDSNNITGVAGLTTSGTVVIATADINGGSITGITDLAVADGGTGQGSYTNGQLLIGNSTGNTLAKGTLTAGTGMTVTNAAGAITIATTAATTGKAIAMAMVFG
jgi:hypothetical protein